MNVNLIGTSINHYDKIKSLEELYQMEYKMYDIGKQYLKDHNYYPGFFMY